MSILGGNDILFLLGAGASKEAGLLTAEDMIRDLETKVTGRGRKWPKYRDLYFCVKSALLYADGVQGRFDNPGSFNIERLVNAMRELEQNEEHPVYPFVASWNMKLQEYGGVRFEHIREFRRLILSELVRKWVHLRRRNAADYYKGIVAFQGEWGAPLHVFSLNYDLCLERACDTEDCRLERGFLSDDEGRTWEWRRFEDEDLTQSQIYLFKMHGSLDWTRNDLQQLTFDDDPEDPDDVDTIDLIFGTNYKLSYRDPYLYYIYSFRRYALEAKLLICVGYGFQDPHVNEILCQALRQDTTKQVLAVTFSSSDDGEAAEQAQIADILGVPKARVSVQCNGAQSFFLETLKKDLVQTLGPKRRADPF